MTNRHTPLPRAAVASAFVLICGLVAQDLAALPLPNSSAPGAAATTRFGNLPLVFEPNVGQAGDSTSYVVHHGQAVTAFHDGGTVTRIGGAKVAMTLDGAAPQALHGEDELASTTNYFRGNDPAAWHTDVPNFGALVATGVYPGIDVRYYGTGNALEHDFIVQPGADYRQIAVSFSGADSLRLDADGNLVLAVGDRELTLNAPVSYQGTDAAKHTVPSRFELDGSTVTIAVADTYDRNQPLVIDPSLVYSTYLGGTGDERATDIKVDSSGNVYVTGKTDSTDFPTGSPYDGSYNGDTDAFVTKLNAAGTAILYSTYLGGTGNDEGWSLHVDTSGNAYVTGNTKSTDFPTASALQASNAGDGDIFVTKLNPAGSALVYSTYLGGSGDDGVRVIDTDASGNAYIFGDTNSTDMPLESPYQAANGGGADFYLAKLNPAGSALSYATYLGGPGPEFASFGMEVSESGDTWITGAVDNGFPLLNPYQPAFGGGDGDAFVAKFDTDGTPEFITYLGGTGINEYGAGIAIDNDGNGWVVGGTPAPNFPLVNPLQASFAGEHDMFITEFSPDGQTVLFSTYWGGNGWDEGLGIAFDAANQAHISGGTSSDNFPTVLPYQATYGGSTDAFAMKLSADTSTVLYSTYLGGSNVDYSLRAAVGSNGNVYLTGMASSTDFPVQSALQATNAGGNDAFVAQIADTPFMVTGIADPLVTFTLGSNLCDLGHFSATETKYCTHTFSVATNAPSGYTVNYVPGTTLTSSPFTIDAMPSQAASVTGTEQFGFNLAANTAAGSHTAGNFGAAPSGGSGAALSGYQTANLFKFATAGGSIAQSAGPSLTTSFTVSFIANITIASEAGAYSTPVTYTIVANY